MFNFVVMGEVPGTSIIISFSTWVLITLMIVAATLLYKYAKKHKLTRISDRAKLALINRISL